MRDASLAILREIGVETGGSNVQFAVNPADGRMVVIEMNPRVSRSQRAGEQGDGVPDRQDRGQARRRVPARRDPQRHHARDARVLRADDRLRGHEDPPVGVREVPRGRSRPDDADEVGRRGHGDRPDVQGELPEGPARPGGRPVRARVRQEGPLGHARAAVARDDQVEARHAGRRAGVVSPLRDPRRAVARTDPHAHGHRPVVPPQHRRAGRDRGATPRAQVARRRPRRPHPRGEAERVLRPPARDPLGCRRRRGPPRSDPRAGSCRCSSSSTPARRSSRRSRPTTIRPTSRRTRPASASGRGS